MELSKANKRRLIIGASGVALVGVVVGAFFLATKAAEVGYRPPASDVKEQEVDVPEEGGSEAGSLEVKNSDKFDGRKEGTSDLSDFGQYAENPYKEGNIGFLVVEAAKEYSPTVSSVDDDCKYLDKGYYICSKGDSGVFTIVDALYQRVFAITSTGEISKTNEDKFIGEYPEAYFSQGIGALDGQLILQRGTVQDLSVGGAQ